MLKINAKALGIKEPIIIEKITMGMMRKVVAIDLNIAKLNDTTGKSDIQAVASFVDNLAEAEKNTFEVLGFNEKQREYVDNHVEPMTFLNWFSDEFAAKVFTQMMHTPKSNSK